MNETTLKYSFEKYNCLLKICNNAQSRAASDGSGRFIKTIEIPLSAKKVKNKEKEINSYFDKLQQHIFDYSFLDIVAIFEKTVFIKFANASGEIKKIVKKEYAAPNPFHMASEAFVKNQDDIHSLAGLKKILEGKIPTELSSSLSEIIEHRNWIAHGKRVGKQSNFSIEELHNILKEILSLF